MKKLLLLLVVLGLAASSFAADDDENKAAVRVKSASTILEEIQTAPDTGIPDQVMGSAQCVAVVPSMLKAGFIIGGRYGRGVASCRTPKGWSDPAFFTIEGGSWGLQIGGHHAAADTDWTMRAQILSYSRARGIFAGLELNGSVIKVDRESTREFYGHMQPFRTTLETVSSPQGSYPFLLSLSKWAKLASK